MAEDPTSWGAEAVAEDPTAWGAKPIEGDSKALNWSDVPGQALQNVPHSAVEFGKAVAQPFMHPLETFGNLAGLGSGILGHLGLGSVDPEDKEAATQVGKFFADRYGGVENIKKTLAEDPVGAAADVSTLLSGGSMAGARGAGLAARAVDPIGAVTGAAKLAGRGAAEVAGLQTGVGSQAIREAAKAGVEGGEAARAFRENITGRAPMEEAVADAQNSLSNLRNQRGKVYREGMVEVANDPAVLDFDKIDNALADVTKVKTYKGIPLDESTQDIRSRIGATIADWKALPANEYHTAEGIDALKQKIGNIRDVTQYGTPERVVADKAYHAIRSTITEQAPEYAKVMRGYEEASKQIKTLQRELSIPNPDKGNVDTSLRKLQSALRDNVNTSFGRRRELAQYIIDAGSPNLMYKLAGQALHPLAPRGLQRLAASVGMEGAALLGLHTAAGIGLGHLVPAAALLPMTSPRLMGEAAYWGGTAARPLKYLPRAQTMTAPAFQLGRIQDVSGFKKGGRVMRTFRIKA